MQAAPLLLGKREVEPSRRKASGPCSTVPLSPSNLKVFTGGSWWYLRRAGIGLGTGHGLHGRLGGHAHLGGLEAWGFSLVGLLVEFAAAGLLGELLCPRSVLTG